MIISISKNKDIASVKVPAQLMNGIIEEYPEMSMIFAMEELNELGQAISKCVRNGSSAKKDNLAEEIVDVLTVIQWVITRFDISLEDIQKWAKKKALRTIDREKTDETIFRSEKAKGEYKSHHISKRDDQLVITQLANGKFELSDTKNIEKFYKVLNTAMEMKYKTKNKKSQVSKKAEKTIEKALKSASKKSKKGKKDKK